MWILIRLVLAAIGFTIRQFGRRRRSALMTHTFGETPYFRNVRKSKRKIVGFTIGMERETPTWIRLHVESAADRLFKAIGITTELQTGDQDFDRRVYVTCDHPHVATVLRESIELRRAILAIFDAGYKKVFFDGTSVQADRRSNAEPDDHDLTLLRTLRDTSRRFADAGGGWATDRFLWKALVVEGVIWSIAAYAIGAVINFVTLSGDLYPAIDQLWTKGLIVAGAGFAALFVVIVVWLRGSSRGHRVIVESVFVLLLSLPVTGTQVVADTNRALDRTEPVIVERTYSSCETRRHRRRRGGTSYTYHLHLVPDSDTLGPRLPSNIQIPRSLCTAGVGSGPVTIAIGAGRWGVPWYRWIRIGSVTWTPSL